MDAYIGEIRLFAGSFAPAGWLFCNGQVLLIQNYAALYSLLGNTYGGDIQQQTFALPDLQGRVPMGFGEGAGLSVRRMGDAPGANGVTLTPSEMPSHTHAVKGKTLVLPTNKNDPKGAVWANTSSNATIYTNLSSDVTMASTAVSVFGGNQVHNNVQPCVGINYIICVNGGEYPVFD